MANAIDAALQRHAPHLLEDCIPLGTATQPLVESHAQEMSERSDPRAEVTRRTFEHERLVSADDWTRELETHSPVSMLDSVATSRVRRAGWGAERRSASDTTQDSLRCGDAPLRAAKRLREEADGPEST